MTIIMNDELFLKERGKIIPLSSEWSKFSIFFLDQKYSISHITEPKRYAIRLYLNQGYKKSAIARIIGKDKSVITIEIKRNSNGSSDEDREDLAQRKNNQRLKQKNKQNVLEVKIFVIINCELERLIMSCGEQVKVIENPNLQSKIKSRLHQAVTFYITQ